MKVGSCVEMESPGPRLYTHLPTRADGQDRARGPRPSSPIEPPGGAPLLVFSSPPFLDSTNLISLLVLHLLLSFSSSYTASRISASSLSFSLFLFFFLSRSHSLLPDLGLLADFLRSFLFRITISMLGTLCPVRRRDLRKRIHNVAHVADPMGSRFERAEPFNCQRCTVRSARSGNFIIDGRLRLPIIASQPFVYYADLRRN